MVDATDKILGRLASTIAIHIRGKNLATYTPSVDMGAYVIVVCGLCASSCILFLPPQRQRMLIASRRLFQLLIKMLLLLVVSVKLIL